MGKRSRTVVIALASVGVVVGAIIWWGMTPPLVSDDGTWIVFGLQTGGMVLNADTGKTVINVPFDPESFRRHGDPTGVHFLDGRLTLYRFKDAGGERSAEVYYPASNTTQTLPVAQTVVESVPSVRIAGFQRPEDTGSRQEMAHHLKTPCAHPALSDSRALVPDGDRLTYRIPDSAKVPRQTRVCVGKGSSLPPNSERHGDRVAECYATKTALLGTSRA